MDDTTTTTPTSTTALHDFYVDRINHLVAEGQSETVIADLAAEYEQQLSEVRPAA